MTHRHHAITVTRAHHDSVTGKKLYGSHLCWDENGVLVFVRCECGAYLTTNGDATKENGNWALPKARAALATLERP